MKARILYWIGTGLAVAGGIAQGADIDAPVPLLTIVVALIVFIIAVKLRRIERQDRRVSSEHEEHHRVSGE
jgi:hypothetical protein